MDHRVGVQLADKVSFHAYLRWGENEFSFKSGFRHLRLFWRTTDGSMVGESYRSNTVRAGYEIPGSVSPLFVARRRNPKNFMYDKRLNQVLKAMFCSQRRPLVLPTLLTSRTCPCT